MHSYEIEIKALLGDEARAAALREAMKQIDPGTSLISRHRQLNHYFEGGTLDDVLPRVAPYLTLAKQTELRAIAESAKSISVRSADRDSRIFLFVKGTIDDTTSENGTARVEFEAEIPLTLSELDGLILESGFRYQAKWSREREEYLCKGVSVSIDKNAGYGYLAEFERITKNPDEAPAIKEELRSFMKQCGVSELSQARLERMFAHYNANWEQYYGTDKVFVIE